MSISINIDKQLCTLCTKCVRVCPAQILVQDKEKNEISTVAVEMCIKCGHCVAACPEGAVIHSLFPEQKVHPVDHSLIPNPEQMRMLCKSRRSNRAFSNKPIPKESLQMILEAAHCAPTGSNAQQVKFVLVTNPDKLREISQFTMEVFGGMLKKVKNPLLKPIIKILMPEALRYIPVFERMQEDFANGNDEILRKATATIFIYTPRGARMGMMDANLAYQNGSLMAESLGISQFYTGFVVNASKMKKKKLETILGIEGEIHAGMALAMPAFRFDKYVDRKPIEVKEIL